MTPIARGWSVFPSQVAHQSILSLAQAADSLLPTPVGGADDLPFRFQPSVFCGTSANFDILAVKRQQV